MSKWKPSAPGEGRYVTHAFNRHHSQRQLHIALRSSTTTTTITPHTHVTTFEYQRLGGHVGVLVLRGPFDRAGLLRDDAALRTSLHGKLLGRHFCRRLAAFAQPWLGCRDAARRELRPVCGSSALVTVHTPYHPQNLNDHNDPSQRPLTTTPTTRPSTPTPPPAACAPIQQPWHGDLVLGRRLQPRAARYVLGGPLGRGRWR